MTTVDRYRALYQRATEQERIQGRLWYPAATALCKEIGLQHGHDWRRVARAMAVLSPQTTWQTNVRFTWELAAGRLTGGTFLRNIGKGYDCLAGATDNISGRKVRSFAAAILGYRNAICIDTWMLRAAGHKIAFTKGRVIDCQNAIYELARETGESARDLQAILWIVARNAEQRNESCS